MKLSAREIVKNGVKDKLARNEVVLSMTAKLVRTVEIVTLAKTAGFDSIYVDLEHNSFSLDSTGQICMMALAAGVTPFVRLPSLAPEYISRILDGGALGVIAPHIESAAEAEQVVSLAKYPPLGTRSFSASLPHLDFQSLPSEEVFEAVNAATMVVVMIESASALAQVEEIAAVEGVDMVMIGTNDLCASLGIAGQLDHELVRKAYAQSATACLKYGKHLGIGGLSGHPALIAEFVALGARYISTGTDLSFLLSAASAKAKQMREI